MKHVHIIIIGLGIIIASAGCGQKKDTTLPNSNTTNTNIATNAANECAAGTLEFTAPFTEVANIHEIGPLGAIDGGSHGRSYVQLKEGARTPVYAPADAILEHIVYSRRDPDLPYGEYGIYLRTACGAMVLLDHLDEVTGQVAEYAPTEIADTSAYNGPVIGYRVKAGELMAYSDGTSQARTFDFYVQDETKPVEFINPARWKWNQNLYAQCPYDLYPPELKAQFYNLFPEPNRTDQDCGSPSYDRAGTAAGGWFQGEDTDTTGRWLTFGTYTNYSALTIRQDAARDFSVRDYQPKVKPEEMKAGDEVCYDYEGRWAYARFISEAELQVVTGQGNCPGAFPATEAKSYGR